MKWERVIPWITMHDVEIFVVVFLALVVFTMTGL